MPEEHDTTPPAEDQVPEPLLRMEFGIDSTGHAAASLPVRWSPSQELLDEIRRRKFTAPYLFFTVRNVGSEQREREDHPRETYTETKRFLVKLEVGMQYITFIRPGLNQLIAAVVDLNSEEASDQLAKWMKRRPADDTLQQSLYDSEADLDCMVSWYEVPNIQLGIVQEVNVDREMFAPEPSRWAKWLVGKFFEGRPYDECHFRRRLLIGSLIYTPMALTLVLVLRILTMAAMLFVGLRGINWRFLQPLNFTDKPAEQTRSRKGSVWIHTPYGYTRHWSLWLLNPVVLVIAPLVVWVLIRYVIQEHHGKSEQTYRIVTWGFWHTVLYTDGALVGIVAAAALLYFLVGGMITVFGVVYDTIDRVIPLPDREAKKRARRDKEEAERTATLAKLETLSNTQNLEPRVGALPREYRTLRLRYDATKAAICKPFAR